MTATLLDALATDGGFTFDPFAGDLVRVGTTTGYAIAVPGTERIVGTAEITRERFAESFADLVIAYGEQLTSGAMIGGWLSPERGYMVEVSEIHRVDRATAVALGVARRQEGILDMATGEYIPTGGSGDE